MRFLGLYFYQSIHIDINVCSDKSKASVQCFISHLISILRFYMLNVENVQTYIQKLLGFSFIFVSKNGSDCS
jgi:hypothetical protein